jgi:uncharacterized protein (TIGR02391 family)
VAVEANTRYPVFDAQHLEAIAKVLADTETGLTGTELGHLLANSKIPDTDPDLAKSKRLYNALVTFQNQHQIGNHVLVFIQAAMNPVSYTECPDKFRVRKDGLNRVLSLSGMVLGEDGKVRPASRAETLDDALARANRLQGTLRQRKVHADILEFCNAEILQENYFHAVLEAMKSITAKIRKLSSLDGDGADLVDAAFGGAKAGTSVLAINDLGSKTRIGEQNGFASLLKGLYGLVRNPVAHEPKVEWDEMTEQDAIDILTMISLVHRKLDKAKKRT